MCFVADFHREEYVKLEIALALMRERDNGTKVRELRKICGRSEAWVYQHLALNDLVPDLKKLLYPSLPKSRRLSFAIGCRLARLPADRQMEVYQKVLAITGSRFQLIETKRLVAEIVPDKPAGRPRKPRDYVRNLRLIVPRCAADAVTADGFSGKVFQSLAGNTPPEVVATMLTQIDMAVASLKSLREKIAAANPPK